MPERNIVRQAIIKDALTDEQSGPPQRTSVDDIPVDEELQEMRCRCCGVFMGYRRRIGRFVFWCSEDCSRTPMAKWDESQIRDETIVAMFLDGKGIMEISRDLYDWPYQYVQQTLARRGLQEWQANEYEPAQARRLVRVAQKAS